MKNKYLIFLIFVFLFPIFKVGAVSNTGFITGQIWFSQDPLVEGDTIKIYTAVWNGNPKALSAQVVFYDKNVILGEKNVQVAPLGVKEVYISWQVTSGEHSISAKLVSPYLLDNGKKEEIVLLHTETETNSQYVPVTFETASGEPVTTTTVVKSELEKITSSIDDILPSSVVEPLNVVSDFRNETLDKITKAKEEAKNKIQQIKNQESGNTNTTVRVDVKPINEKLKNITDTKKEEVKMGTDKPITYIKLFFLTILSFIFTYKLVFYGLIFLIIFLILRFLYRKIRGY